MSHLFLEKAVWFDKTYLQKDESIARANVPLGFQCWYRDDTPPAGLHTGLSPLYFLKQQQCPPPSKNNKKRQQRARLPYALKSQVLHIWKLISFHLLFAGVNFWSTSISNIPFFLHLLFRVNDSLLSESAYYALIIVFITGKCNGRIHSFV